MSLVICLWRASRLIVIMSAISNMTRLTLTPPGGSEIISSDLSSSGVTPIIDKGKFFRQITDGVNAVTSIRKFNQFLKLIIGVDMTSLSIIAIVGIFSLITTDFNASYLACFIILVFIWLSLVIIVYIAAKIIGIIRKRVVVLSVLSARTNM